MRNSKRETQAAKALTKTLQEALQGDPVLRRKGVWGCACPHCQRAVPVHESMCRCGAIKTTRRLSVKPTAYEGFEQLTRVVALVSTQVALIAVEVLCFFPPGAASGGGVRMLESSPAMRLIAAAAALGIWALLTRHLLREINAWDARERAPIWLRRGSGQDAVLEPAHLDSPP